MDGMNPSLLMFLMIACVTLGVIFGIGIENYKRHRDASLALSDKKPHDGTGTINSDTSATKRFAHYDTAINNR